MNRHFLLPLLLWLWLALPLPAEPPQLSIFSGEETAPLAALLTTHLSAEGRYRISERDDLTGVVDEQGLFTGGGTNIDLKGSHALLFLSEEKNGEVRVRLASVQLGQVIFDHRYPSDVPVEEVARLLGLRLDILASKLSLPPETAIPLAILNLRVDYASSNAATLEQHATVLLEQRLAQIPEVIVLERRRLYAIAFERTLNIDPQALLRGTYLLDGSLSVNGDTLIANIRLRSPKGKVAHTVRVTASHNDLPKLADQITQELSLYWKLPTPPTPAATSEAREYLLEGIWAFQRRLYPLAITALDSAELLGETAPDLYALRASSLCNTTVPPQLLFLETPELDTVADPEEAYTQMLRALDDLTRYRKANGSKHLQVLKIGTNIGTRIDTLDERLFRGASKLLGYFEKHHPTKAQPFRTALKHHADFAPEQGKISHSPRIALEYGSLWADSLEEECALYTHYVSSSKLMLRDAGYLPRLVTPESFGSRFVPDPQERRIAYLAYWKMQAAHADRAIHALYLIALHAAPEEKEAACRAYYELIWRDRAALLEHKLLPAPLTRAFRLETGRGRSVADPLLINSLIYFLENAPLPRGSVYPSWNPNLFPKERAAEIWAALQSYQQRMTGGNRETLSDYSHRVAMALDLPAPKPTHEGGISLHRFWTPDDIDEHAYFGSLSEHAGRVIVIGRNPIRSKYATLFNVSLATHLTEAVRIPYPDHFWEAVELNGTLYLPFTKQEEIACYHLETKQWSRIPVPGVVSRLYASHGQLYGVTRATASHLNEAGIIRVDPRSGQSHLLASSRRRPAQSPFDDRGGFRVTAIFPGPQGRTYAVIDSRIHEIRDTSGDWPSPPGTGRVREVFRQRDQTLIQISRGEKGRAEAVYAIGPDRLLPELWLGPISSQGDAPAPDWSTRAHWLSDRAPQWSRQYGTYGEDLIALVHDQRHSTLSLLYYRRGRATPITIPLHFAMDAAVAQKIKQSDFGKEHQAIVQNPPTFGRPNCRFFPDGIVIGSISSGFWFLPFSEITSYINAVCSRD